jgi:hypothetical protein
LYTDRPSKDEQLYRKTIFGKDKKIITWWTVGGQNSHFVYGGN